MRVFFTSDTHFVHPRVAELRGFASAAEHDDELVRRWNAVVRPRDTVWHCGDVGGGSATAVLDQVDRLNGTIHLVAGNHDQVWPGNRDAYKHQRNWLGYFASVQSFACRKFAGVPINLSHFPYNGDHTPEDRHCEYRLADFGAPILHGHTHASSVITRSNASTALQVHVGVDAWDFHPASWDDIVEVVARDA